MAAAEVGGSGGNICTNTCRTSHDNECDDGGPGSLYNICEYGSDCADCGARPPQGGGGGGGGGGGAINRTGATVCTNTCHTSHDNECDDGGPGSLYNICEYGSDCADCGARPATGGGGGTAPATICNNSCPHASDGECDDGGPGSLYNICAYGSDCNDCGARPAR